MVKQWSFPQIASIAPDSNELQASNNDFEEKIKDTDDCF